MNYYERIGPPLLHEVGFYSSWLKILRYWFWGQDINTSLHVGSTDSAIKGSGRLNGWPAPRYVLWLSAGQTTWHWSDVLKWNMEPLDSSPCSHPTFNIGFVHSGSQNRWIMMNLSGFMGFTMPAAMRPVQLCQLPGFQLPWPHVPGPPSLLLDHCGLLARQRRRRWKIGRLNQPIKSRAPYDMPGMEIHKVCNID